MYFPYLRGKQFELLALRDLVPLLDGKQEKISPIIEPVKDSSALKTAVAQLDKCGVNLNIVLNPTVGGFSKKAGSALNFVMSAMKNCENYQAAVIVDSNTIMSLKNEFLQALLESKMNPRALTFIHNEVSEDISELQAEYSKYWPVRFNVVNFKRTNRRYYRQFPPETRVSLDDYFLCLDKNADYVDQDESHFTEEHLYYRDEGFVGFSDFLTIGDNYVEGGFLPYAVVIHLSYADEGGRLKVKHFVSDSNEDTSDVAGKFAEAIAKLVQWCDASGHNTKAVQILRGFYERGHFPGLGTLKKLSLMNHIELVLSLI